MASPAHCFYCFECLSASFTRSQAPELSVIEDLWDDFESSKELVLQPDDEEVEGEVEADGGSGPDRKGARQEILKLPTIGRLQEPSTSLRSSSSSTPSALSTSSSRSVLTSATSVTSPSSPPSSSLLSQSKAVHRSKHPRSPPGSTYPLFVTWNTISRIGHKSLRGCIGTFEAQDLAEGLKSYALTSAFGDTRFSPIPEQLLPSLSCSLTLLSSFETCSHPMDWDLGTHGLRISFIHRGRRHGSTYLPDVAVEQGWTKEETLESLMRKAGWDGHTSGGGVTRRFLRSSTSNARTQPWEDVSEFKAVRYQGLKASADYAEWQEWRKWAVSSATGRAMLN